MSNDYHIEDELMVACPHPSSVILYMRVCTECGNVLENEVIEPGTETLTHKVTMKVKP